MPSLTCRNCGKVLSADTEAELACLGQEHAREHGHTKPMSSEHIRARIRRHNPEARRESPQAADTSEP